MKNQEIGEKGLDIPFNLSSQFLQQLSSLPQFAARRFQRGLWQQAFQLCSSYCLPSSRPPSLSPTQERLLAQSWVQLPFLVRLRRTLLGCYLAGALSHASTESLLSLLGDTELAGSLNSYRR